MLTPHYSSSQKLAPPVQAPRHQSQAGRDSYRNSEYGRPASSVYSQPSPAAATFAAQQLRKDVYNDPNDISPPSSPDLLIPRNVKSSSSEMHFKDKETTATLSHKLANRLTIGVDTLAFGRKKLTKYLRLSPHSHDGADVSPIEEADNHLFIMNQPTSERPSDQGRSNIPMMRRERRKNSAAAIQASRDIKSQERPKQARPHGNDIRWDPRTGEPTVGEKGRPSQIDPHHYVQRLSNARAPTGAPQQAGQQPISPFGVRLKPAPRKTSSGSNAEPLPRPEWRGGSGRTALVEPVSDNKSAAPLNIPRKSSKRATRGPGVLSPVSSLDSETASPPPVRAAPVKTDDSRPQLSITRNTAPSSEQGAARTESRIDAQSYPSPPLSDEHSVPVSQQQRRAQRQVSTPSNLPQTPNTLFPPNDKAIRRKPAGGAGHNPHISTSSSLYSQQEAPRPSAPPVDDWVQPPSRFSVTTYATSAHTSSPRPSVDEAPPLPTPPRQFTESPKPIPASSILDRKRPVVSGYEGSIRSQTSPEPIKINMDSYYTTAAPKSRPSGPRPVPYDNYSTLSVVSVSSADKSLPLAPPEQSARDRVTMLNAQIESLGNRRININHAIKQMTELMPTDNVLASDAVIRKRENEKRKVETLKAELADVQREEYELGLKLHRAYKRIDREAEYEPTTLWVRRVTG
ncbi:hypothetical protein SUNI508_06128 [Seiridium unicorne]|uniref:Uncharacterized protein n=1 Tax=Seiridium unicorne TaxID=138068 RepID=A0ABR2V243_9PEZI